MGFAAIFGVKNLKVQIPKIGKIFQALFKMQSPSSRILMDKALQAIPIS